MPYKIVYKPDACIGAGDCAAVSPTVWSVNESGKAVLSQGTLNPQDNTYERIINDQEYQEQRLAAEACPVGAIEIHEV